MTVSVKPFTMFSVWPTWQSVHCIILNLDVTHQAWPNHCVSWHCLNLALYSLHLLIHKQWWQHRSSHSRHFPWPSVDGIILNLDLPSLAQTLCRHFFNLANLAVYSMGNPQLRCHPPSSAQRLCKLAFFNLYPMYSLCLWIHKQWWWCQSSCSGHLWFDKLGGLLTD